MTPEQLIKQAQDLANKLSQAKENKGIVSLVGSNVVVKLRNGEYWFGKLEEKSNEEILLSEARHLVDVHPVKGISMLDCITSGITNSSRAIAAVPKAWFVSSAIYLCPETIAEEFKNINVFETEEFH